MDTLVKTRLMTLEEAQEIVFNSVPTMEMERMGIINSLGRTLAEDVRAEYDVPLLDNSSMDGYAVIASDTAGASDGSPRILRIVSESSAGSPADQSLSSGCAIRIMTGAPMPSGADSIIPMEDTRPVADGVAILRETTTGENIRPAGQDARAGDIVLGKGTLIGPSEMGLVVSVGKHGVTVARKPRVSVITTGDELIDVMETIKPGQVKNSNRYSLAGMVFTSGCDLGKLIHAKDDPSALKKAIVSASLASDAIITSGGVSVGKYDFIRDVLGQIGELLLWKVAIKPGKPFAFGKVAGKPVFALPGNPASAIVTFELFVRPALFTMLGRKEIMKPIVTAHLSADTEHEPGRREFARAKVVFQDGRFVVSPTGNQSSGLLKPFVEANCLMILPEGKDFFKAGEEIQVMLLDAFIS